MLTKEVFQRRAQDPIHHKYTHEEATKVYPGLPHRDGDIKGIKERIEWRIIIQSGSYSFSQQTCSTNSIPLASHEDTDTVPLPLRRNLDRDRGSDSHR